MASNYAGFSPDDSDALDSLDSSGQKFTASVGADGKLSTTIKPSSDAYKKYDWQGAFAAGLTSTEILDALDKANALGGYRLKDARKAGLDDDQIAEALQPKKAPDVPPPTMFEYLKSGLRGTKSAIEASLTDDPEKLARISIEQGKSALPQTPAQKAMAEEIKPYVVAAAREDSGISDWALLFAKRVGQFATNPREFAGAVAQNIPNSAPGMAGTLAGAMGGASVVGPIGGVVGGMVGGTAGGYGVEQGSSILEQIQSGAQAAGIDPSDEGALAKYIKDNYADLLQKSRMKGIGTAGTDAALNMLTMGVAGAGARTLAKETNAVVRGVKDGTLTAAQATEQLTSIEARSAARNTLGAKVARGTGITTAEVGGEMTSEGVGQYLRDGKIDPLEVVDEGIVSLGHGPVMAAGENVYHRATGGATKDSIQAGIDLAREYVAKLPTASTVPITGDVKTDIDAIIAAPITPIQPRGSFSSIDELATFAADEKADLANRRNAIALDTANKQKEFADLAKSERGVQESPLSTEREQAPKVDSAAPGSDAGNGFKRGPQQGERFRVSVVNSVGGAVALEKRSPSGTPATFYIGKDGNLVDGDSVNLIGNGVEKLWIPENDQQRQRAIEILDEMGRLALDDPARKVAKAKLRGLATGQSTAPLTSQAAPDAPLMAQSQPKAANSATTGANPANDTRDFKLPVGGSRWEANVPKSGTTVPNSRTQNEVQYADGQPSKQPPTVDTGKVALNSGAPEGQRDQAGQQRDAVVRPANAAVDSATPTGQVNGQVRETPNGAVQSGNAVSNDEANRASTGGRQLSDSAGNAGVGADRRTALRYNPEVTKAFNRARELLDAAKTDADYEVAYKAMNDAEDLRLGIEKPAPQFKDFTTGNNGEVKQFDSKSAAARYQLKNKVRGYTPREQDGRWVLSKPLKERSAAQKANDAKLKAKRIPIDVIHDDMLEALRKGGGINMQDALDNHMDRKDIEAANKGGFRKIFKKGGMSMDAAREYLAQGEENAGYLDPALKDDLAHFIERLTDSVQGQATYRAFAGQDYHARLSAEAQALSDQKSVMALTEDALAEDEFDQLAKESQGRVQSTWDSFDDELGAKIHGQDALNELTQEQNDEIDRLAKTDTQDSQGSPANAAENKGEVQRPESAGKSSSPEGNAKEAGSGAVTSKENVAPVNTSQERVKETGKSEQVAPKQPWQMTFEEYRASVGGTEKAALKAHRNSVIEASKAGETIPPQILHEDAELANMLNAPVGSSAPTTNKPKPGIYSGPADVSSREGQIELANRAGTIASIQSLNSMVRGINETAAYTDGEISNAKNIDAIRDYLSAIVASKAQSQQPDPLTATLNALNETMGRVAEALTLQNQSPSDLAAKKAQDESKAAEEKRIADLERTQPLTLQNEDKRAEGDEARKKAGQGTMFSRTAADGPLYSRAALEDPTNLIVTHNLSAENFMHSMRMGGIPVPSLAITKANQAIEGFGGITLIGDKDLADPRGYAKPKVFGADVYSPRYPTVDYKWSNAALKKLNAALAPFREENGRELYGDDVRRARDLTGNDAFKKYVSQKLGVELNSTEMYRDLDTEADTLARESGAEERIFQGHTYNGNRRYIAHSLENVVKILKKETRGGENFNYGVGSLRAKFTPQFKSIKQIKENAGRLVSKDQFEAIKKEVDERFWEIANELSSFYEYDANRFGYGDIVTDVLGEAPKRGLRGALKEYGFTDVDQETLEKVSEFLNQLRTLPTEYFEAKIMREVDPTEFKVAVVPEGTKQDVIDALKSRGLEIRTYDGSEPARKQAVESAAKEKGLLFSRQPRPTQSILPSDARAATDVITKKWKNAPKINVHESLTSDSVPEGLRSAMEKEGVTDARGAWYAGGIELFPSNIGSLAELERTIVHEARHYGLEGLFGKDMNPILMEIYMKDAGVRKEANRLAKTLKLSTVDAVNETLANMDLDAAKKLPAWKKLVAKLKAWLNDHGFTNLAKMLEGPSADAITKDILYQIEDFVKTGKRGDTTFTTTLFSKKGDKRTISPDEFQTNEENRQYTDQLERALQKGGGTFRATPVLPQYASDETGGRGNNGRPIQKDNFRLAEKVAGVFGKQVVWVRADGDFGINGVIVGSIKDKIFIDVRTKVPAHAVMGHEMSHWIEKDSPEIYSRLMRALDKVLIRHEEYRAKYNIPAEETKADISKEIVGDLMGDAFADPQFWSLVAQENPGPIRGIANKIMQWLNNAIAKFNKAAGFGSDAYVNDLKVARHALAKAVAEYALLKKGATQSDATGEYSKAYSDPGDPQFHRAFHGTPHDFDQFSLDKIGTGEGAQAYGHGLYFAGKREVAEYYKNALGGAAKLVTMRAGKPYKVDSAKAIDRIRKRAGDDVANEVDELVRMVATGETTLQQAKREAFGMASRSDWAHEAHMLLRDVNSVESTGKLYEVELAPKESEYLDWDKPLSEQSEGVRAALALIIKKIAKSDAVPERVAAWYEGRKIYQWLAKDMAKPQADNGWTSVASTVNDMAYNGEAASNYLKSIGIPGIRYLDGSSRSKGEGHHNYVLFDAKDVTITAKYSRADQVSSPAFKRWFGNSRVVDSEGNPLVVYHGTAIEKDSFRRDRGNDMAGIYFATNPEVASDYAEMDGSIDDEPPHVIPAFLSIKNPKVLTGKDSHVFTPQQRDAWESEGFDGAVNKGNGEWIAFYPEQIKSAIGNNGDFDGTNPDIRYSRTAADQSAIFNHLRSASTAKEMTGRIASLLESDNTFNRLTKNINTQFHKAQLDKDFKRVFDAIQSQMSDTEHYAIEAEKLAPDVLIRMQGFSDIGRTILQGGKQYAADMKAIAQPLFANIEGKKGVKQFKYTDAELKSEWKLTEKQIKLYHQYQAATAQSIDRLAQAKMLETAISLGMDASGMKNLSLEDTHALLRDAIFQAAEDKRNAAILLKSDAKSVAAQLASLKEKSQKAINDADEKRRNAKPDELKALMQTEMADPVIAEYEDLRKYDERVRAKSQAAQEAYTQLMTTRENLDTMRMNAKSLIDRGYTPAMRFGDFEVRGEVSVQDEKTGKAKWETKYMGRFESQAQANAMKLALQKEHPEWKVTKGKVNPNAYKMLKGVSPESFELMAQITGNADEDGVKQYIALAKSSRAAEKRLLERQGIAGFSEDASRVLAAFVTSNARATAQALNSTAINEALASKTLAAKGDVQAEAQNLVEYVSNPNEEASKLRGLLFMHYMGGSIASGLVNLTQPILQTAPHITKYVTGLQAFTIMKNAAKAVATNKIPEKYKSLYQKAIDDGITEPHEIHQLMADAGGSTLGRSLRARAFVKAWGGFFSLSEAFNRKVTFLAAIQAAEQMGPAKLKEAGFKSAYEFAKDTIIQTQGLYNKGNRPNMARGAIGATLFTFKQFSISYVEWLSRLPRKQQLVALALLVLASGLEGLPFAEDIEDLIDTLGHRLGYATNSRKSLRNAIASAIGQEAAEYVLHGSSRLTALDLSGRLGMGNLIPGTAFFDPANKNKGKEILDVLGAAGGLAKGVAGALDGDIAGTLPTALKNITKAYQMADTGEYKDSKGRLVMKTDAWDAIVKSIGFQPTNVAEASKRTTDAMNDLEIIRYAKSDIADKWAQGIIEKKPELVAEARKELTRWNLANPGMRVSIKPADIESRVKEARLTRDQRILKSAPAGAKQAVMADLAH